MAIVCEQEILRMSAEYLPKPGAKVGKGKRDVRADAGELVLPSPHP